ncbi:MAG: GNAT family N-acetyltransferase [Jatrophihabitans sp.]|uniref:GNAT family N-acetyltransferase n=1 Tax=Jatrophihabitans sp. TaxID=1932789 RepID=UPI003914C2A8
MPGKLRFPTDHEPRIDVRPAINRFDDFAAVVGRRRPDARGCWCMAYRDSRVPALERPEYMRAACDTEPGPGVLVYVDDDVAGWCSIAPRATYRRLVNSRTIPAPDDPDTWVAVCFVVRAGYRKHGLMHHLLDGAVQHALDHGAQAVEGYPVDDGDGRVDVISGYVGTVQLFERAGFERAAATAGRSGGQPRVVMRKLLR